MLDEPNSGGFEHGSSNPEESDGIPESYGTLASLPLAQENQRRRRCVTELVCGMGGARLERATSCL